jgi:mono/diheme cytochrome c family protein
MIRWAVPLTAAGIAFAMPAVLHAEEAELAPKGRSIYHSYCALCHGPNLVNRGSNTFDLRKFPLDQPERFLTSVKKGKRAMPPWGDRLSNDDIKAIWAYVKTRGKS